METSPRFAIPPAACAARLRALLVLAGLAAAGLVPPPAGAQAIGRLFSTVEQRIVLDELRAEYEYGKPPPAPAPVAKSKPAAPVVPQVTINGVVVRSSGNNASWINGTRILAGDLTPEGIRVVPDAAAGDSVRLLMPSGLAPIELKAGQKIDVVTGDVVDAYLFDTARASESVLGQTEGRAAAPPAAGGEPKPPPSPLEPAAPR